LETQKNQSLQASIVRRLTGRRSLASGEPYSITHQAARFNPQIVCGAGAIGNGEKG
jgi:hypothetical protein